jgi:hypothetical protein
MSDLFESAGVAVGAAEEEIGPAFAEAEIGRLEAKVAELEVSGSLSGTRPVSGSMLMRGIFGCGDMSASGESNADKADRADQDGYREDI